MPIHFRNNFLQLKYWVSFGIFVLTFFWLSCGLPSKSNNEQFPDDPDPSLEDPQTEEQPGNNLDNLEIMKFSVDYLMGKFDPGSDSNFTTIRPEHCSDPAMTMRKDAYESFVRMFDHAAMDNIPLKIISATRPFDHQKRIWEGKWSGKRLVGGKDLSKTIPDSVERALKILEYSSMPGTSRHHWGTDIDLNALENSYFESGKGMAIYNWLLQHAASYGFCQPYTAKGDERPFGYEEEKWHWSYEPVSRKLTASYKGQISNDQITGFEGSQVASTIDMIGKYVLGISKSCF